MFIKRNKGLASLRVQYSTTDYFSTVIIIWEWSPSEKIFLCCGRMKHNDRLIRWLLYFQYYPDHADFSSGDFSEIGDEVENLATGLAVVFTKLLYAIWSYIRSRALGGRSVWTSGINRNPRWEVVYVGIPAILNTLPLALISSESDIIC